MHNSVPDIRPTAHRRPADDEIHPSDRHLDHSQKPPTRVTAPDFLTVEEAAKILRIGRSAAYEQARAFLVTANENALPAIRIGKLLRVPRHQLEALIGAPITWPPPSTDEA